MSPLRFATTLCLLMGTAAVLTAAPSTTAIASHGRDGGDDRDRGDRGVDDRSGSDRGGDDHSGSGGGDDHSGSGGGDDRSGSDTGSDDGSDSGSDDHSGSDSGSDDHSGTDSGSDDHSGSNSSGDDGSNSGSGSNNSGSNSSGDGSNSGSGSANSGGSRSPVEIAVDERGAEYRAHEIVVVGDAATAASMRALGFVLISDTTLSVLGGDLLRIEVPATDSDEDALRKIRAALPAAIAGLNHVYRMADGPAAPHSRQAAPAPRATPAPAPRAVHAAAMHRGAVGIIDTSVDGTFPGLDDALIDQRSFATGPLAADPHGTAVADIVHNEGGANVVAANVFAADRAGHMAASTDAIVQAMNWLVAHDVAVINISLVGPPNPALAEAVRRAQAAGVVIVAAAGNEGAAAPPAYPGAFPSVVAVTAVDGKGAVYRYANRGNYISFAAPGVDVNVATGEHARATASGTSYASPVVAALIAREVPKRDGVAAAKAIGDLTRHARDLGAPGRDTTYGYGLVGLGIAN